MPGRPRSGRPRAPGIGGQADIEHDEQVVQRDLGPNEEVHFLRCQGADVVPSGNLKEPLLRQGLHRQPTLSRSRQVTSGA